MPLIEGQVGDSVTITCTSPRPDEALNIYLSIYIPQQESYVSLDVMDRLTTTYSGSIATYMFGPLIFSDNGSILACFFSGVRSANTTIIVICKLCKPQAKKISLR